MSIPIPTPSTHTENRSGSDEGIQARIDAALVLWRTRLLDLSKRNRALNFKTTRVSTVTIVDEQPVEVFRHLCVEQRPMRFRPTLPSADKAGKSPRTEGEDVAPVDDEIEVGPLAGADDTVAPQAMELDFAPYDPEALDERHKDDVLQALATPEALDKSLRRLDEQSRMTIEEQGVNVLFLGLGMLHYVESSSSKEVFRAPLVMVPVTLARRSARAGYTLSATDDDAMVNPALIEYLRQNFGIDLPQLRTLEEGSDDTKSLQEFYRALSEIASAKSREGLGAWSVKTDIFLGLFSFQKLVMFKDLEANASAFGGHAMIRQLISRESSPGVAVMGLPEDVRDLELDRDFAPENSAQVVDADSSQLRAIAAVSRGYPLVIEGPPGTGKSQTITNLIAQALSEGKSVLFVAEKMAALKVVHRRLVAAGLGEFCLELHASKANKRGAMQELKAALDASLQRLRVEKTTHRLPTVRGSLSDYSNAAHTPYGELGFTPFAACGMLDGVIDAPRLPIPGTIVGISREKLVDAERLLADLAGAARPIGPVWEHPWRDTNRTFYTPGVLNDLSTALEQAAQLATEVELKAAEVDRVLGLRPIRTRADVSLAVGVAELFSRSPGAPTSVLESDAWNSPPAAAIDLVETVRNVQRWRAEIDQRFNSSVLEQPHGPDIGYVERKVAGVFGFLAFLDSRFRTIKRRWHIYRRPDYTKSIIEQADDLKLVDMYLIASAELKSRRATAESLFGPLWGGEGSDPGALERYMMWVKEVRAAAIKNGLTAKSLSVASNPSPDLSCVAELQSVSSKLTSAVDEIGKTVEWPTGHLAETPFADVRNRLQAMMASSAPDWATLQLAMVKVSESVSAEALNLYLTDKGAHGWDINGLARSFRRWVLEKFLDEVTGARLPLREFRTLAHEQRIREFRQLDERVLEENKQSVVARLREATQQRLQSPAARAGLPFIQREMAKQRNLAPLRKTLQHAEATVRAIKPCFLMSPLTVAQYLGGAAPSFDLVIFDEASQLPSEDAVGAISRGRQLVVVGDPKQLPPTNFFSVAPTAGSPLGDDGLPLVEDSESVLEEYMGAGVPVTRLKWHYRSTHESLITFSNVSFYDSDLYTFPNVETHSDTRGLSFEFVPDGVYEGKGLNIVEARRVVDAVVRHAKGRPHESLGVGTFNLRQQLAILDELELRRRQDPELESFFARDVLEPFFVKNLENIQGDERDVIFLSVTYAKGPDGRLRYHFGPINGENGWRRLNVLTTRARKGMRVFSSMRGDDINAAGTTSRGALLLRDFLRYAEFGRLESVIASATAAAESPFEAEVAAELVRRGVKVQPQIGAAGYRIDLGVLDDNVDGRYICGIECDGVAYHSAESARDRDRLRQQVLEARGWNIIRLWSTDWFKDRQGQIDRLMQLISAARDEAKSRVEAEAEADARARELAELENRANEEKRARVEAETLASIRAAEGRGPYVRPTTPGYIFASPPEARTDSEFQETPLSRVTSAVTDIVQVEAPVHVTDVATRIASWWGLARVGARISAKVDQAINAATRSESVTSRGSYLWSPELVNGGALTPVRSREGTKIPGSRVAKEEVQQAICLVLRAAGGMSRDELLSEVRQVLGVGRASVSQTFGEALETLVSQERVGEGSAGYALRG